MRLRRVAVTGMGLVAPTGIGKDPFWQRLLSRSSAVDRISRFDASTYLSQVAAEVRDVSYRDLVPVKKLRTTGRFVQYSLAALQLALADARLSPCAYDPDRRGVSFGTSLGGIDDALQQEAVLLEKGARRVNPFLAAGANHVAGAELAIAADARGTHATLSTGCCASMHALGHGALLVATGALDCCITGGAETPISPLILATMMRTHELSTRNDDPSRASSPFDNSHDGVVVSEGAAVLIIEDMDKALRRGAVPYAEVVSHSSSIDASDMFQTDASGSAAALAIHRCLTDAHVSPADLDYVCANGNSLPAFDRKEASALRTAISEFAARVPVSSIKGVLGHPFGASAAFQTAAACLAIRHSTIPPTANLLDPDPLCNLNLVTEAKEAILNHVLVTSYGFGGINAYLLLRSATFIP